MMSLSGVVTEWLNLIRMHHLTSSWTISSLGNAYFDSYALAKNGIYMVNTTTINTTGAATLIYFALHQQVKVLNS